MMMETKDPEKLRKRVQWLRRRELELRGRVFGPRYTPPNLDAVRFIGHIGDYDAYLVDEFTHCKVWLTKRDHTVVVAKDDATKYPALYPLHAAVLELAEQKANETFLSLTVE